MQSFIKNRALADCLKLALLLALAAAAYYPALNAGFIWDDDHYVIRNANLLSPGGLRDIWLSTESPQYYPLVFTTFWIEQHIWGLEPAGFHAVNILLHAANAALIWMVCRRLDLKYGYFAALIFALHPVHVESVAWVTERKNVLSGFFYLLSLLAFLSFEKKEKAWAYAASLAFFFAALLSKTVACTLPVAIIIIRWLRDGRIDRNLLLRLVPFFGVGLVMGLVTVWWELNIVGARGDEWALPVWDRLLLPGRIAFFYAFKLLLPFDLSFIYERWTLDLADLWQWIYPVALFILLAALFILRDKTGKGALAAVAFFLVTLFPALGFFNVYPFRYSFVADHFQYLASAGLIVLFAESAGRLTEKAGAFRNLRFAAAPIIIALGALAWNQTHIYKDLETLWRDTLSKNPDAFIAHTNLGALLYERGVLDEAVSHYQAALRIKPDSSIEHFNLGLIYYKSGKAEEALNEFRSAVKSDPENVMARVNLGTILTGSGDYDEALVNLSKAVEVAPGYPLARKNIAVLYDKMGKPGMAIEHLEFIVERDPGNPVIRKDLAIMLSKAGRAQDAIAHLNYLVQRDVFTAEASNKIGEILAEQGRRDEAVVYFKKSLSANPGYEKSIENLKRYGR
ncbi:MAG: hypothetical protein A2054_00445 [Deltaproteobacteria bacterium GWA2_55_10]|nr:MAG: hypothetical protein A2054_00445 [Deltaproteobacteria bacterium GWA2_55_10]